MERWGQGRITVVIFLMRDSRLCFLPMKKIKEIRRGRGSKKKRNNVRLGVL